MMASHRPADAPLPPPPDPAAPEAPAPTAPTGLTTLPQSNFLVGFDWVLAFGVLALAFLIASFAVKNSDFWMHLAAGRLLAGGQYEFGKDPFSYSGGDRTWVNHAWLYDWFLYQLYKAGDGAAVVIAKAVALAVTAGLLLLARRPGQSVFPGVVCVGLALPAAAPRLLLQPTVCSFLFLAALMFLLIRVPRRPGSWLFPGLVAGLFLVWVNCDQWFLLGPAALLLYTAGQYIRADEGEDVSTLWKALGIGVLAALVNPHHVRAWLPPAELVDGRLAETFAKDPEFAGIFRGALSPGSLDFTGERDNPVNLYALLALVALGIVGFAVNRRRASAGLALVWVGAVALAVAHLRAIPFLAFVAAPVAAVNLATAGRRLAETPLPDGTVRTLHALRAGGRAAAGLVGLLMIALSYPGWLHPFDAQRRWRWDTEPNPSLVRAAEKVRQWREAGTLPEEARLLNLQPDFASYVAWYAPGEKTFFDYRLGFHRGDEAGEYAALRRYLSYRDPRKRRQDPFDLPNFLDKHRVTFAVYAPPRLDSRAMLAALWQGSDTGSGGDWALWDVQGRAVTFGWTRQRAIPSAAFDRLRFDPLRLAYAEAEPLPKPADLHPPPPTAADVWERFLVPAPTAPVDAEEAMVLLLYRQTLLDRAGARQRNALYAVQVAAHTRLLTPALNLWTAVQANPQAGLIPTVFPPTATAVSMLAVRAARRAVVASPDHPDGYYFLAAAYSDIGFPSVGDLKDVVATASLARARARVSDDPTQPRPAFEVTELARNLFLTHDRAAVPPRRDLALDALNLGVVYLRQEVKDREAVLPALPADVRDAAEADLEDKRRSLTQFEKELKDREAAIQAATDRYTVAVTTLTSPVDRAAVARRFGLVREAILELRKAQEQFQKQLGDRGDRSLPPSELATLLAVHAELVELLWYDGKVEESGQILDTVDTPEVLRVMDTPAVRQEYARVRQRALGLMFQGARAVPSSPYDADPAGHFRNLRRALAVIVGDFDRATEVQTQEVRQVRQALAEFRARTFPAGVPDVNALPDPQALRLEMYTRPVLAPVTMARMIQLDKVGRLRTLAGARAEAQVALGLTYLEWGDVPRAAYFFGQAGEEAPGWPAPTPAQRLAREFVRAIDQAGAGRGARP